MSFESGSIGRFWAGEVVCDQEIAVIIKKNRTLKIRIIRFSLKNKETILSLITLFYCLYCRFLLTIKSPSLVSRGLLRRFAPRNDKGGEKKTPEEPGSFTGKVKKTINTYRPYHHRSRHQDRPLAFWVLFHLYGLQEHTRL